MLLLMQKNSKKILASVYIWNNLIHYPKNFFMKTTYLLCALRY